jgi:hypothetical protein
VQLARRAMERALQRATRNGMDGEAA